MAQAFMSYQTNDFGEKGVWIKPHSSETETLKSVQVHQLTASPCGGKSYGTDSLHPLGPCRVWHRPGSRWYHETQGSDTCLAAGSHLQSCSQLLESPAVLLGPHQLTGTQTGMWPLCSHCVANSRGALEVQTPAKLSSWLSSHSVPSKPLLPPHIPSLSPFLPWGLQGCHFCHLRCQPAILADPC